MTMTGMIIDGMCGASHPNLGDMHKEAKRTDRDCTRVRAGGKYGFVSEGKVINQDPPALQKAVGESVQLTGHVKATQ